MRTSREIERGAESDALCNAAAELRRLAETHGLDVALIWNREEDSAEVRYGMAYESAFEIDVYYEPERRRSTGVRGGDIKPLGIEPGDELRIQGFGESGAATFDSGWVEVPEADANPDRYFDRDLAEAVEDDLVRRCRDAEQGTENLREMLKVEEKTWSRIADAERERRLLAELEAKSLREALRQAALRSANKLDLYPPRGECAIGVREAGEIVFCGALFDTEHRDGCPFAVLSAPAPALAELHELVAAAAHMVTAHRDLTTPGLQSAVAAVLAAYPFLREEGPSDAD